MRSRVFLLSNDEEATVGAARELSGLGYDFEVIQTPSSSRLSCSSYLRTVKVHSVMTMADAVRLINETAARLQVYVIPLSDWGLEILESHRAQFGDSVHFSSFLRNSEHSALYNKAYFYSLCNEDALAIPPWHLLADGLPDASWFNSKTGYVIKPVLKRHRGEVFSGRATDAADSVEVRRFLEQQPVEEHENWIVQHRVNGKVSDIRQVDFYMRSDGSVTHRCTIANVVSRDGGFGTPAICEVVEPIAAEAALVKWLQELNYEGGINAEFFYDRETDQYRLFDLNARCGGHIGFTYATGGRVMQEILRSLDYPGLSNKPPTSNDNVASLKVRGFIRPVDLISCKASLFFKAKYLFRATLSWLFPRRYSGYFCPMFSADDTYYFRYFIGTLPRRARRQSDELPAITP